MREPYPVIYIIISIIPVVRLVLNLFMVYIYIVHATKEFKDEMLMVEEDTPVHATC